MSGPVILFLLLDGGIKLVPLAIVTGTSAQIGLPTDASFAAPSFRSADGLD